MAHAQFKQVAKLVMLLDDQENDIYLHIDKKVKHATEIFNKVIEPIVNKSNIYFISKNKIQWGGVQPN